MMDAKDVEVVNRLTDEMVAGFRRESDKPFTGLAYSPSEAVQHLRVRLLAEVGPRS